MVEEVVVIVVVVMVVVGGSRRHRVENDSAAQDLSSSRDPPQRLSSPGAETLSSPRILHPARLQPVQWMRLGIQTTGAGRWCLSC